MKKLLYVIDRSCNQPAMNLVLDKMKHSYPIVCDSINIHQYKNSGEGHALILQIVSSLNLEKESTLPLS